MSRINLRTHVAQALKPYTDRNGSDSYKIGPRYPTFYYHTFIRPNTYTDLIEYEYKTNVSESDFYSDIYSTLLKVYIVKFNMDE